MAEINSETNSLRISTTRVLRKHYKWLLWIVGLPGISDLVREYIRGRAMDWAISKLGWFGDFLVANPVALTSIGVVSALIVLTAMVVSESSKEIPSFIYEHRDKQFTRPAAPTRWIVGFAATMMIMITAISFGTYKYWLHTSHLSDAHRSDNTKAPSIPVQPIVTSKPEHAPTETGHSKHKTPTKKGDQPLASGSDHIQSRQQGSENTKQTAQQPPVQPPPVNQGGGSPTQVERMVQADRNLPKGDRDRLTDAFFEFSQILDQANAAFRKAANLKVDEKGPLLKDLATRRGKISGIESAAKEFENRFYESRRKWKYYGDQIAAIFGDDPDNHALILRNAAEEYARQLDSVLALKDTDEAKLKAILWPEDIRYDEAMSRFALWTQECERRLKLAKSSLQ